MASLISKASLLMVPSVYEDGTLYNVLPSGNKAPDETGNHNGYDQTRADFTFSRGSNLSATRIGPNGLIEKGRENLLTQSNNFSHSDWNVKAGTFTQGVADPDGGNNAWAWEATNTDPYLYQSGKSKSGVSVLSIWVKGVGSTIGASFQIRTGAAPYKNLTLTGEWQRVEHYNTNISSTSVGFEYGNPAVVGDVVHIYQAQYEVGTIATAYMDSGATTATAGVLENTPRIDYSSGAGALLLEPSRSNLITYGNYFNGWSKTSASVTTNAATSPDGLQNASKLVEASGSSFHFILSTPTIASGAATFSFYAKAAERTSVSAFLTQSGNNGANFDLSAETATAQGTGNTASIESVGNGWYRCIVSNSGGAQIASQVRIGIKNGALDSYVGDGTSGVYIYGAQCEQASYHLSLIPTHGAAVTRGADVCNSGGSAESINSTEGVLYTEMAALVNGGENRVMTISDGSYDNSVRIQLYTNTNEIEMRVVTGNAIQALQRVAITNTLNFNKVAVKYKANDFQLWVNGSKLRFDTSGTLPSANTFNTFNFDDGDGNSDFYGKVKQVAVFDEALSDAELVTLTT